ncbi:hypothetical protein PI125_g17061 [Phytophthora idaei]|nr:hypothetical protein PI125_g17061 [Phytophthora idaei]KAG3139326.1 hypothetical protein PI126_g16505 [Phytophthora idaei]
MATDAPNVLEATTYYDADTQGVPPWMTKIVANRKAKNPQNLEHLIRLEHVMKEGVDPDSSLQEKKLNAKVCVGCNAVLPKWGRHRKCRDCCEFICKSCSDVVHCAIQGRRKLNQICVHCVDDFLVRTNRQLELTLPSSVSFQSDDASTPGSLSGSCYSSTAESESSQPKAIDVTVKKEQVDKLITGDGERKSPLQKTRSRHAMSEGTSTPATVDLYLKNVEQKYQCSRTVRFDRSKCNVQQGSSCY